jgi:recombinational DNA repair protein RecR
LESENPGTANVVIRTSSKVRTTMTELSQVDEFSVRCKICLAPNDVQVCSSCSPIKEFF